MQYAIRFKEEGKVGVELLMTVSFFTDHPKKASKGFSTFPKRERKEKKRTLAFSFGMNLLSPNSNETK